MECREGWIILPGAKALSGGLDSCLTIEVVGFSVDGIVSLEVIQEERGQVGSIDKLDCWREHYCLSEVADYSWVVEGIEWMQVWQGRSLVY